MFALTGDAPEAVPVFARAMTLLGGRDPRKLVRSESLETLRQNRPGQILCALQALGAAAALRPTMPERFIVAGYSIGEVAAWGVAGLLNPLNTLDLVAFRAEAMDAASLPGDGLLFVRGLARHVIDGLCDRHQVAIAILDPGDSFVIGGSRSGLDAFASDARAMSALRVIDLPVTVASHTRRLVNASTQFREALRATPLRVPLGRDVRVLSGIDGSSVIDVEAGLDKLAAQVSQTVRWTDCLQGCVEAGATAFLELGPGHALSAMANEAHPEFTARSLDDFKTLQGARNWVAAV